MLKQRLDFPVEEKIETMDGLAIIKGQKIVNERSDFPGKETIETKDKLAIIQGQKTVESTVAFSRNIKDGKLLIDWL